MPLSEFYRMTKDRPASTSEKNTSAPDLSVSGEIDVFELVWENGQVLMQGQSSRARKPPTCNTLPSHLPKIRDRDITNFTNAKTGRMSSVFTDTPFSVPSAELCLNHDDDLLPWFNYAMDEPMQHDYSSDFLPELSGVTVHELLSHNSFTTIDKRIRYNQVLRDLNTKSSANSSNPEQANMVKVSSTDVAEANRSRTSTTQSASQKFQSSLPHIHSKVSDGGGINTSNVFRGALSGSLMSPTSTSGLANAKTQKRDQYPLSNSSTLMNFSHFSRPTALVKANIQNKGAIDGIGLPSMQRLESNDKGHAASVEQPPDPILIEPTTGSRTELNSHRQHIMGASEGDNNLSEAKSPDERNAGKQAEAISEDNSSRNDEELKQCFGERANRLPDVEPVVASSVCSGNSVERTSDEPSHNLKRKCQDIEESECHSEDVEESMDVKKSAPTRGGTGSKRSRAAEVHNLSERRRRDRINEKMRALQDLIPNCNKVDKASMLDEAIEYLKTLQLQVQIMSMGAGFYMPPMMIHAGMQHMNAPHMAHFSHMGFGMGMGVGFGRGVPGINGGSSGYPMIQVPPMQAAHFPGTPISAGHTAMHGMTGSNLQVFGLPAQGVPMSMLHNPLAPFSGGPLVKSDVGLNACKPVAPAENVGLATASASKDPMLNGDTQLMHNIAIDSSINPVSSQKIEHPSDRNGRAIDLENEDDRVPNKVT